MGAKVGTYIARSPGFSVVDTGDMFQMRMPATRKATVLSIRMWQTSVVDLFMNLVRIRRGVGGAGGNAVVEQEYDTESAAPGAVVVDLPTTDVGTIDWEFNDGHNILQPFIWLPTPAEQLIVMPSDHIGVSWGTTNGMPFTSSAGFCIIWEEEGV